MSENRAPIAASVDPSMEDILASIRRILSEDEADGASKTDDDDDVLVLDSAMMVPMAPVTAALKPSPAAIVEPPPGPPPELQPEPQPQPQASVSPPETFAADTVPMPAVDAASEPEEPAAMPAPPEAEPAVAVAVADPVLPPAIDATADHSETIDAPTSVPQTSPEPEMQPLSSAMLNDDQVGLVAPEAAAAAASSVGTLMRTLTSERTLAVSRSGPTLEDMVREEIRPLLKQWLDANLPPTVERLVRAEIERVISRV